MKIGIQTWGSEGDVRPLLALGQGLAQAGHEIHLVYSDVSGTLGPDEIARAGAASLRALPLDRDGSAFRQAGRELLFKRASPLQQIADVAERLLYPMEVALARAAAELCARCDVVIGHFLLYPLAAAAAWCGRPRLAVFTAPAYPSRSYVPAGTPDLGPLCNGLLWWLGGPVLERVFGDRPRRHYRDLGLPPPRALLDEVWSSPLLNLVTVSPSLFPPPADWPAHHVLCGSLALRGEVEAWQVPAALQRFLDAGEPPIYLTFGSMMASEDDPTALLHLLVEAVRRAGCRALVQADWERARGVAELPGLFRLGRGSHAVLFPRCAAVVHHGGAGTTHAVARAGKPHVVVTHATDQAFWADLLRKRGLARAPLRRQRLRVDRLARAIRDTLDDTELAERAARVGAVMQQEDGVARAVALVETALGRFAAASRRA